MGFIDRIKEMFFIDKIKNQFHVGSMVLSKYVPGRPGTIIEIMNNYVVLVKWDGFFLDSGASVPDKEEHYYFRDLTLYYPPEYGDFQERIKDRLGV